MKQPTINLVCLLLAVAGISFGVGQSVGQDRAGANVRATKSTSNGAIVNQLKKIRGDVSTIRGDVSTIRGAVSNVEAELTKGERSYGGFTSKTVRGYVVQTCRNTATITC